MLVPQYMFAIDGGGIGPPAGGNPSVVYFEVYRFSSTSAQTVSITHPAPGYRGKIVVFLVGMATCVGSQTYTPIYDVDGVTIIGYDPDFNAGYDASGESASFIYQCRGDETSFSIKTLSAVTTANGTAQFLVNGGANNGIFCAVGSGGPGNGTQNAVPPSSKKSTSHSIFTADLPGGAYTAFISAQYGVTTASKTYTSSTGSKTISVVGKTSPGGLNQPISGGTQIGRGVNAQGNYDGQWSGVSAAYGGAVLAYLNNVSP